MQTKLPTRKWLSVGCKRGCCLWWALLCDIWPKLGACHYKHVNRTIMCSGTTNKQVSCGYESMSEFFYPGCYMGKKRNKLWFYHNVATWKFKKKHIWKLKVKTLLLIYHHKLSTVPACVSGWTAASRTPGYTPPSDTSPACGHTLSLPADAASTGGTWSARIWHQPANYITWVIHQDSVLLLLLHQLQPPLIKITLVLENGVCSTWLPEEREQFISTRWELICQFVCVSVCGGGAAGCVLVLK